MDYKEEKAMLFIERLTLKEIKRIFRNQRQTIAGNEHLETCLKDKNESLQLSTHSELDVTSRDNYLKACETDQRALLDTTLSPNKPNIFADWDVTSSDSSFLKYEKLTKESCKSTDEGFDNTLEAINYINGNPPGKTVSHESPKLVNDIINMNKCLKTPDNPPLFKKPSTSSLKKTLYKNKAFKHIASPVAYYINNSPQVPLIQNTKLKKSSPIPKPVKPTVVKPSNKQNINLPAVAYRSAKKTTVIDVSNGLKLPQCPWANRLTKSLPRPTVMKHAHREKHLTKRTLLGKPDDSFGDLSLHQADLSVCTKKLAF